MPPSPDPEDGGELERFYTASASFPTSETTNPAQTEQLDQAKIDDLLNGTAPVQHQADCFLGKDVLLQGKIFFTKKYLLYYAHLPPATLDILKATPLDKKGASRIPGKANYTRFWFVLRMGSLSWYADAGDKYFPVGMLPLHLMEKVTRLKDQPDKFVIKAFNGKSYTFRSDSSQGTHEWVKFIRKEMFRSKVNTTDFSAVVRIPLQNIISSSVKPMLDIAQMLSLQVVTSASDPQNDGRPMVGNYCFVFFGNVGIPQKCQQVLETSTNNFENMSQVKQVTMKNQQLNVDFEHSVFGRVEESMLDTTPPAAFHLYEGTEFDTKNEVLRSPGLIDAQNHNQGASAPSINSVLSPPSTQMGEPAKSQTPSIRSEKSVHKTRNPFKKLKEKLQHHSSDDEDELSDEEKDDANEISKIIGITSMPYKLIANTLSSNQSDSESDDEDADWDYGSGDVGKSVHFNEEELFAFTTANNNRKVTFSPNERGGLIESTHVDDKEKLKSVNTWFQDFFGLEPFVKLLSAYICDIEKPQDQSVWEGKLMISNLFLCFQRFRTSTGIQRLTTNLEGNKEAGGSGDKDQSETRMVIPLNEIIHFKEVKGSNQTELKFEVSAAAYGVFTLRFHSSQARADAEQTLKEAVKKVPVDKNGRFMVQGAGPDFSYIDYDLRTSRLATYEPSFTRKLQMRIPPLFLDPTLPNSELAPKRQLKFAMLMIGSRGDVQPYIALSQGLMKEGHKCVIVTHEEFKPFVEKYGIEHRTIAGDPRELMELMISHGSISYSFLKDALHHFKSWLKELMQTSWDQFKDLGADVMLESPSSMIGLHIAEALNIPYFRGFTMPWTRTKMYPQALIQPDGKRSGTYNALTYTMYERAVWLAISHHVNKWRKKQLKLPSTDLDNQRLEELPFLYCVSPTVLVPPVDQPEWVHTCGYWELQPQETDDKAEEAAKKEIEQNKKDKHKHHRHKSKDEKKEEDKKDDKDGKKDKDSKDGKKKDEIDPKLKQFIEDSHNKDIPVVYIGFGSIIVKDPQAMTDSVVKATKEAKVNCVLARGWSARSTKDEKKKDKKKKKEDKKKEDKIEADHVYEVDAVDHQWLFPRIEVCVHHGGSGTTGASLRAGKPTIIKPFFGDQFFYGRRVEDLGVGKYLKELTTGGLRDAIRECINDKELVRQAKVLGEQIRLENGVKDAILSIYRELEYATMVTYRRRKRTEESAKNSLLSNPTNILTAPAQIFDHGILKRSFLHNFSKTDDEEPDVDEKGQQRSFSFPEFSRREEQELRCTKDGVIDVSL